MRKLVPLLAILFATAPIGVTAERPLFTATSEYPERPPQHEVRPGPALIRALLATHAWVTTADLDECLNEHHLRPGDYGSLLHAIRIPSVAGRSLWFVRGRLDPWCETLNGAHGFHAYLFEERPAARSSRYRLLFYELVDDFDLYRRQRHGVNDIEPASCTASECWSARLGYDGRHYRALRCTHIIPNDRGPETRRPVRCRQDRLTSHV